MPVAYFDGIERWKSAGFEGQLSISNVLRGIWADTHELTLAGGRYPWWGRLHGYANPEIKTFRIKRLPKDLPGGTKTSLWNKDGKACVWASISYHVDEAEVASAAQTCGLSYEIPEYPAWHQPTTTRLILWRGL